MRSSRLSSLPWLGAAALSSALLFAASLSACSSDGGSGTNPDAGTHTSTNAISLDVTGYFAPGTTVRDTYSGKTATVDVDGKVAFEPDRSGVVLLEKDGAAASPFTWANATVYFVITDRFQNGDPSNDSSYGRTKDGQDEVGTWHGGDLKGLTAKLDHIASLGATAIWITPPVEQVHGWVAGGSGNFQHWGYHGYWAMDFTKLDANLGTTDDLRTFVDAAHQRGIRVLFDVVMNHPGYATGKDLVDYLPEVIDVAGYQSFQPDPTRGWLAWNDLVNYESDAWVNWWGPKWIRAGFPHHMDGGNDDITKSLNFLPDFRTEVTTEALLPVFYAKKTDTLATLEPGFTTRQYLVKWHSDWVRQYGIDGFRCDTAKHVELASWKALKDAGTAALAEWKAANPTKKLDDAPFWMTGEVFPHGVTKDDYFTTGGFDSLINFDFQRSLSTFFRNKSALVEDAGTIDGIYSQYSNAISADPTFDVLSYISSHDTDLFFATLSGDEKKMAQAATALLLVPGSAQIFYGDESGRARGPAASDSVQGTRSDMNWSSMNNALLAHWQKLGSFRKSHAAIGAGTHAKLTSPDGTYAFGRKLTANGVDDAVVVLLTAPKAD